MASRVAHNRGSLAGDRFGNLLVEASLGSRAFGKNNDRKAMWLCICDCGKSIELTTTQLKSGKRSDCGCVKKKLKIKNSLRLNNIRAYRIWQAMLNRCRNQKSISWKNYGGRGITVCEEWSSSFEAFLSDMGGPPEGFSIN